MSQPAAASGMIESPGGWRPPLLLILVALVYLAIGGAILLLAAVVGFQVITWDVKGFLLTGWRLALFTAALVSLGALALVAALRLWKGRPGARVLALGFWFAGGAVGLVTDRSVSGPGEPLWTYVGEMALLPALLFGALLFGVPGVRRYLDR
jgi:hypothetical protein